MTLPDLHQLSEELKRPMKTLVALSDANDPFHWTLARHRNAKWFAEMWG
jgi:hypothetical protein